MGLHTPRTTWTSPIMATQAKYRSSCGPVTVRHHQWAGWSLAGGALALGEDSRGGRVAEQGVVEARHEVAPATPQLSTWVIWAAAVLASIRMRPRLAFVGPDMTSTADSPAPYTTK
jgi:hypothetical protein